MKYIVKEAVKNKEGKLESWKYEKEFTDLQAAEQYCFQNFGTYTEPSPQLEKAYFGSNNPNEEWNGKLEIE